MDRIRLLSQTRNQANAHVAVLLHESSGTILCGWLCSGCEDGQDIPAGTPAAIAVATATRGRDAHADTCHAPPHD
ncbi:hypothetical protein AB0K71_05815 [Streptomyces syringium]|uniref:hypothetical protein n=1 Tax=Streptomyces syringium TaxID=76729 RepID=UPI00343024D3